MRLAYTYYVTGEDGVSRPYTQGTEKSALPADVVQALEGNPRAFTVDDEDPGDAPTLSVVGDGETGAIEEPPRSGKGSGRDAWAAFAEANGVPVDDESSKDDIVEGLIERGVIE